MSNQKRYEIKVATIQDTTHQKIDLIEIGSIRADGTHKPSAGMLLKWKRVTQGTVELQRIGIPLESVETLLSGLMTVQRHAKLLDELDHQERRAA